MRTSDIRRIVAEARLRRHREDERQWGHLRQAVVRVELPRDDEPEGDR